MPLLLFAFDKSCSFGYERGVVVGGGVVVGTEDLNEDASACGRWWVALGSDS